MNFPDFFLIRFVKHHLIHKTHQKFSPSLSGSSSAGVCCLFLILSEGLALMMEDQQRVGRISATSSDSHNLKKGQTNWYIRVDVLYNNVLQEKPKIHYKLYI